MGQSKRRATYDDLLKLPDHVVGEIIDGDLIATPRPAAPHTLAASGVGHDLTGPFQRGKDGPGGWWILFEPELHFGQDVLVPDLAGWRRERMPTVPSVPAFELPPDWVCEIVSPSTARVDRTRKTGVYARVGIPHLWILDPLARTLEVLGLASGRYTILSTHAGNDHVRAEPFAAVELDMSLWWTGPEESPG